MKHAVFAPLRTARTIKDDVLSALTEALLAGKLKPGERLNESHLARQLEVSRAPIREALQQLMEQGLVVSQPRRGMFVVQLSDDSLRKINRLRLLLESEALELCRSSMGASGERRLKRLLEQMENPKGVGAIEAVRLDLEFHRAIWQESGDEYLERALAGAATPMFAFAAVVNLQRGRARCILDSHRPLYAYACGEGKAGRARNVVEAHLATAWNLDR